MAIMGWNEAKALDDTLTGLDDFFPSAPVSAELLSGGLSNRCWKLTDIKGRHFVWRPVTSISRAFCVDRAHEYTLLQALRGCDFAPDAVVHLKHGLLVRWLEGEVLSDGVHPLSLMTILARIHQVRINNKPVLKFNLTERVDAYWFQLDLENLSPDVERIYTALRSGPYTPPAIRTLCHFDLGGYNLLSTRTGIAAIDWEYAAIGDPRMDLAMTCDIAGLDSDEMVRLYCAIRGIEEVEEWQRATRAWLPHIRMMAMLWYYLGFQLWDDEAYREHGDRLRDELCHFSDNHEPEADPLL